MENKLKSVALHITNECSSKCPFCYYTKDNQLKIEGKLEILKKIGIELQQYGVEEVNFVGGDPAEHSQIEELSRFYHGLGIRVVILSNTHRYKNSSVERIAPYVASLEGTFHASSAKRHNAFNNTPGSYELMIENLKKYDSLRGENQNLGAVLNVMNSTYDDLYPTVEGVLNEGLNLDYVLIQRIGEYGKAKDLDETNMELERLAKAFEQVDSINKKLGIESVMVDAFPLCLIPKEYHKYLGCCEWGTTTLSMDMNGDVSRCAVASHCGQNYLGNILQTPIREIWESHPTLLSFRSKDFVDEECQKCNLLAKCGGGCPESCGTNILSSDILVRKRRQK